MKLDFNVIEKRGIYLESAESLCWFHALSWSPLEFVAQFEPEQSEGLKLWQQILEGLLQHHRYLLNVLIHWFKGLNPTKVMIASKKNLSNLHV